MAAVTKRITAGYDGKDLQKFNILTYAAVELLGSNWTTITACAVASVFYYWEFAFISSM